MKTFNEFKNDIKEKQFNKKMNAFIETKKLQTEEEKLDYIVEFARENGYDVSVEDFALDEADMHKLDDEELAKVSGGGRELCGADYICITGVWNNCSCSEECSCGTSCSGNLYCKSSQAEGY